MSETALAIPDEVTDALTAEQKDRLAYLEGRIAKNFMAFVEVGMALKEIRDNHLFIETHPTFEMYVRDKYEIAKNTANQKIQAAEVLMMLQPVPPDADSLVGGQLTAIAVNPDDETAPPEYNLLPNEAQARKLAELPPKDRPDAWKRACQRGIERHGRVTAKTVAEVVAEKLGKRTELALVKAKASVKPAKKDEFVDPSFTKALQAFLDEISAARIRSWYGVPKSSVLMALRVVLQAIEAE